MGTEYDEGTMLAIYAERDAFEAKLAKRFGVPRGKHGGVDFSGKPEGDDSYRECMHTCVVQGVKATQHKMVVSADMMPSRWWIPPAQVLKNLRAFTP